MIGPGGVDSLVHGYMEIIQDDGVKIRISDGAARAGW